LRDPTFLLVYPPFSCRPSFIWRSLISLPAAPVCGCGCYTSIYSRVFDGAPLFTIFGSWCGRYAIFPFRGFLVLGNPPFAPVTLFLSPVFFRPSLFPPPFFLLISFPPARGGSFPGGLFHQELRLFSLPAFEPCPEPLFGTPRLFFWWGGGSCFLAWNWSLSGLDA